MRFALMVVLALVLAVAAWIGVIRELTLPAIQIRWVQALYTTKEAAAARIHQPKILIIGGSGIHFGYLGEAITRQTGIPTVNFGTHAGLGGDYLLYRARKSLKAGDWAILALEPELYVPQPPNDVLSEYVLRYDLSYLLHAPNPLVSARIVFGLPPVEVIQTEVRRSIPYTAVYGGIKSIAPSGDETAQLSKYSQPYMVAHLKSVDPFPPEPMVDPAHPPTLLQSFLDWAKRHNVTVAQAWVPMLNDPAYKKEPYLSYFKRLREAFARAGGVTLGEPTDYFQPIENMFDYELHDNEFGRARASAVLAREICKVRVCPAVSHNAAEGDRAFAAHPEN